MKNRMIIIASIALAFCLMSSLFTGCGKSGEDEIVLRVSNWEEYIDLGDWDEDEVIELSEEISILGENTIYEDFELWYEEEYGKKVRVEYSTFGTNEDLYNQLLMGDTFDLVCPSEYMIMKMQREDMLIPYSKDFYDKEDERNYYAKGVSPFIWDSFDDLRMENGESLNAYTAGYMWGTLGFVYNPEFIDDEDARNWNLPLNEKYRKQVTIKDSVRDSYFLALGNLYRDEVMTDEFLREDNYRKRLSVVFNRSDEDTVQAVEDVLSTAKDNVYSFEVDSGKADIATGKILANQQWSGDAVYTMDVAEEEGVELSYAVPDEGTNMWFDGWVMLKDGIGEDADKKQAAQAFVNFVSRPDNVIRNMYYIGYTSVIAGGDDESVIDYANYLYESEDEEDMVEYPLGYFFSGDNDDEDYIIYTTLDQTYRQLYAQYPTRDVVEKSVVMACFLDEDNERINRMWINVRCFDFK